MRALARILLVVATFAIAFAAAFLIGGCWAGTPQVIIQRDVRYVHDEPLSCAHLKGGLPAFPSIVAADRDNYVSKLSAWVIAAGMCLGVNTYNVAWFIRPVTVEDVP